ncbi:hypothetical protein V1514DRAFT_79849 [Lipomyces japonicus]|uniref:uncharacterized protein n=1 Tax=Lipomyces japonicus TaxID=56871 RepID=UPI0034CE0316
MPPKSNYFFISGISLMKTSTWFQWCKSLFSHACQVEATNVTRHQVCYRWQKTDSEIWQRNSDSAYEEHYDVFTSGNLKALGFYASIVIQRLRNSTAQLVMNATFGASNGGMSLFAILAKVEDTGVPLAYCLVERLKLSQVELAENRLVRADPGPMTHIIHQFLERLKRYGIQPKFFGIDKDAAEIAAVGTCMAGCQNSTMLLAFKTSFKHEAQFIQKCQHAIPLQTGGSAGVDPRFGHMLGLVRNTSTCEP